MKLEIQNDKKPCRRNCISFQEEIQKQSKCFISFLKKTKKIKEQSRIWQY